MTRATSAWILVACAASAPALLTGAGCRSQPSDMTASALAAPAPPAELTGAASPAPPTFASEAVAAAKVAPSVRAPVAPSAPGATRLTADELLELGNCVLRQEIFQDGTARLEWVCDGVSRGSRDESASFQVVCSRHDYAFVDLLLKSSSFAEGLAVVRFTRSGDVLPVTTLDLPKDADPECEGQLDRVVLKDRNGTRVLLRYAPDSDEYLP